MIPLPGASPRLTVSVDMIDRSTNRPACNRLLAALPPDEYARLHAHLTPMTLPFKHVLYDVHQPIEHVYFVNSGVYSILTVTEKSEAIEVAIVGSEGMVPPPSFAGSETANLKVVCQTPGVALRLAADILRREQAAGGQLGALLGRYTQAMFLMIAQLSACSRLHSVEERFCRWVLMTADRAGEETFPITHELLSHMLGVRRASVTVVAGMMQQAGLIHYRYGKMTIRDRHGLEGGVCGCYHSISSQFDRLLGMKTT
jgi:CRP-like cAMP-binding protein